MQGSVLPLPAIWARDSGAVYAGLQGEWSPEVGVQWWGVQWWGTGVGSLWCAVVGCAGCSTWTQVGAVVARVGQNYREAAVALVAKAYTTIRVADLATYLGQVLPPPLSSSLRLARARRRRWPGPWHWGGAGAPRRAW